jgi:hypothetical protein
MTFTIVELDHTDPLWHHSCRLYWTWKSRRRTPTADSRVNHGEAEQLLKGIEVAVAMQKRVADGTGGGGGVGRLQSLGFSNDFENSKRVPIICYRAA